ncbi:MAG: XTP/dITP diphosphatase [Gammaproteobacteria bacterium]
MKRQKIVLASGNQGKLKELKLMLADQKIEVLAQSEFDLKTPEETGLTFVENAILKARYVAEKTGLPAIADDSGIEVDALKGEPGIYSARYAGEGATDQENLDKLLFEMRDFDDDNRQCRFHCVIVLMRFSTDPTPIICHGVWEGQLLEKPTGENGFGYDPVFYVPEKNCSSAQLSPEIKNQLSHRGKALRELVQKLDV